MTGLYSTSALYPSTSFFLSAQYQQNNIPNMLTRGYKATATGLRPVV